VFFLYLISKHWTTKEGLENSCPESADGGCKTAAIQANVEAITYTKTSMSEVKKEITALISKVSKLITDEKTQMDNNVTNIALNATSAKKINDLVD